MTYTTAIPLAQYQAHIGLRLCKIPTVAYWQLLLCLDCWQLDIAEVNNTYLLQRTLVPNMVLTTYSLTNSPLSTLCLSILLFSSPIFCISLWTWSSHFSLHLSMAHISSGKLFYYLLSELLVVRSSLNAFFQCWIIHFWIFFKLRTYTVCLNSYNNSFII